MPKLILHGAYVHYNDTRRDETKVFSRLHCTADYSEPVQEAMKWEPLPGSLKSGKLDGELAATHLILTPSGRELKQHELQIGVSEVSAFEYVRVKEGEDGSVKLELRFVIKTAHPGAAAMVESYLGMVGYGAGQMRIGYEEQDELPMEEAKADDGQEPIEAHLTGAALASHSEMSRKTHQGKRAGAN